jgi:hypothetical protein
MRRRITCVAVLLNLAMASVAAAQCIPETESLFGCFDRIVRETELAAAGGQPPAEAEAQAAVNAATAEAREKTDAELADANPGADTGGSATANTLTDFAPLFDALGLLSSGDSTGNQLAFNLNFLVPVQQVDNPNTQLQLLVNTQPEPLDQLVQSFDETVREARKDSLQKDISTFGDQELKLNWSLVNTRFGRDFRTLRKVLGPIYDGAAQRSRSSVVARNQTARIRGFQEALRKAGVENVDANRKLIKDLVVSNDVRNQLMADTVAAATARTTLSALFGQEIARADLGKLAELVEEQPQLLFSLSHNFRDEIVGPEKTSATVTWEWTSRNLGNFIHDTGTACREQDVGQGTASYDRCVSALENYLAQDLKNQWRFKLEASYQRVDAVSYSFPDDNVTLDLPKTNRLEITAGGGREFTGKPDLGRLDFEVSYDSNVDGDTSNEERVTAAITLTRRMGDVDVPFSIVYANKDEFLGEVDHQIGMHVGVKFRQTR